MTGRIAVTGLGLLCSLGRSTGEFWSNLLEGRRGIRELDLFDATGCASRLAGQVDMPDDFAPAHKREMRRASRTDLFCLTAAAEAVRSAGLDGERLAGFGLSLGSSAAGMLESEDYCRKGREVGFDRAPVSRVLRLPNSSPADAIARFVGLGGPRLSNMTACASSAASIGFAADMIRSGDAPGMLAGGGDALCLLTYSGFNALRLLDPQACRPFDASRQGLSLGEGAALLVLEDWQHALSRGATILAEFIEYGASCDAHHMTAPHPAGRGAAAAMSQALDRAGLETADIAHINAHGTGTPLNDSSESKAIMQVFGDRARLTPMTATKSAVGHLLGGSGAIEAATTVLSLSTRTAPPALGWSRGDEGVDLSIVAGRPRPFEGDYGLSNSFGFGGTNVSLIFRRVS